MLVFAVSGSEPSGHQRQEGMSGGQSWSEGHSHLAPADSEHSLSEFVSVIIVLCISVVGVNAHSLGANSN